MRYKNDIVDFGEKVMNKFYSGYTAIIGLPNVGKSTLMNSILKNKISIVSDKAQTTRKNILGVLTDENSQIIFLDTPGIHKARNKLGEFMMKSVKNSLEDADIIVYVVDCTSKIGLIKILADANRTLSDPNNIKKILVLNKIDLISKRDLLLIIEKCSEIFESQIHEIVPVSAINCDGIDILIDLIKKSLKEGPKYYLDDDITNQTERNMVAEIVRESLICNLKYEIPFGIAVQVENFRKRDNAEIIDLEIKVYCEKDSHKRIIIGHNGEKLKKIGSESRKEIEILLKSKVYMILWVKVNHDWRNKTDKLRNLGYI